MRLKQYKVLAVLVLLLAFCMPVNILPDNMTPPVAVVYATNTFDPFSQIQFGAGGVEVGTVDDDALNYGKIMERYKGALHFVGAILIITSFATMIFRFFRLSASAGNEQERRKAIKSILTTGITLALMGGATILIPAVYELFK